VRAAERLAAERPGLAKTDAVLAELYLTAGEPRQALDAARRFVRTAGGSAPAGAYAETLLGRAHKALGEGSHAAAAFSKAVRQDPKNSVAWKYLASLAAETGKIEDAETCLVKALEADPRDEEAERSLYAVRTELMRQRERRGPLRAPEPPAP
jgi:tetratricopeptide (TPR) repeat protein